MASYCGAMEVMRFPRRLIRHLETPELPLETLEAIHRLRRYLEELEAACIIKARELGASPSDIGDALGITRQAVYNRLHHPEQRAETDPVSAIPNLRAEEAPDLESSSPACSRSAGRGREPEQSVPPPRTGPLTTGRPI